MNHVGEVEFEDVSDGFLYSGVVAADVKDAVAAKEVEVILAVEVVEVGALGAGVDLVETDGALDFDEGTVDVLVVQVVILAQSGEDRVFEVEISHGIY